MFGKMGPNLPNIGKSKRWGEPSPASRLPNIGKNQAILPNIGKGPSGPLLSEAPLRVLRSHASNAFCRTLAKRKMARQEPLILTSYFFLLTSYLHGSARRRLLCGAAAW
jgi:hypothetical protein